MVAFAPGAVLTAANLNTAFNALTFRAVTGTSDTLVLADNGGAVSYSNASPITATVPPFSAVAYANGTVIQLLNLGAGVVTVTAGVGVTLNGSSVTLAQNAGGTLIKTATNTWYFLPSASAGAGMDLITPTSVAGSGVTLSGGQVSFTAATAVSVNGCFTSAYDNYRIQWQTTSSATGTITERLRVAAVDISAANYVQQRLDASGTTVSGARLTDQTAWLSFGLTTGLCIFTQDLFAPALATVTMGATNTNRDPASTDVVLTNVGYNAATAVDGLSLIVSSGNITGTLRVYGLRKS